MESKESGLFSPSIKKSYSTRSPRKSTPSRRRYLRQSFPTLESPTESIIYSTNSFQQKLQDASDEQLQQEQQDENRELEEKKGLRDYKVGSTSASASTPKSNSRDRSTALQSLGLNTSRSPSNSTTIHRDTQSTSETLRDIFGKGKLASSNTASESTSKAAIARPPLRTTETEYDISPSRSARLSTPPRSLYTGTPSRPSMANWDLDETQESDVPESPSSRHFRTRNAKMNRGLSIATQGQDLLNRFSKADQQELSPRYTARDDTDLPETEEEDLEVSDQRNDDGYNYGDDEVSFKRSEPASLPTQGTLIDHGLLSSQQSHSSWNNILNGGGGGDEGNEDDEGSDEDEEDSPLSKYPRNRQQYLEHRTTPRRGNPVDHESEDSLIEMAERTTAIAEELRGVYSNLQELFSPETEAKLNGAVSILNSQKSSGKSNRDRSINDTKGFSSSVPKPPVFERSQEIVQRELSPITKRKPAPLRPAIIKKSTRALSPELRQLPNQGRHEYRKNFHDVTFRGLISDAESARRLNQANQGNRRGRSQEQSREFKSIVPQPLVSKESTLSNDVIGKNHQDIFQKKLDRWRRVEVQNQSSLPTYLDLYIPTTSSKTIVQTDTEDFDDDVDGDNDIDYFADQTPKTLQTSSQSSHRGRRHEPGPQSPTIRSREYSERKSRRDESDDDRDETNLNDKRSVFKRRREDEFWDP